MTIKIFESTFEFKNTSNNIVAKIKASDTLEFLDSSDTPAYINNISNSLELASISNQTVTINLSILNDIIINADIDITSIVFSNPSTSIGQSGIVTIKNTNTRNHSITWSSTISVHWIEDEIQTPSNVSGAISSFYYYVADDAIILHNKPFF